jgi:hypothetical protein
MAIAVKRVVHTAQPANLLSEAVAKILSLSEDRGQLLVIRSDRIRCPTYYKN